MWNSTHFYRTPSSRTFKNNKCEATRSRRLFGLLHRFDVRFDWLYVMEIGVHGSYRIYTLATLQSLSLTLSHTRSLCPINIIITIIWGAYILIRNIIIYWGSRFVQIFSQSSHLFVYNIYSAEQLGFAHKEFTHFRDPHIFAPRELNTLLSYSYRTIRVPAPDGGSISMCTLCIQSL